MEGVTHRVIWTNGISMHFAEAGQGPLVLLLHGFPEIWLSWRHQIPALVEAGYRVVAPDLRGFGQTDAPIGADNYTALHYVGDFVGLLEALGEKQAYVVAHDWGASMAWQLALLRPDLVKGLVALSVPFPRRNAAGSFLLALKNVYGDDHYMLRFQEPGATEAEFARYDTATVLKKILLSLKEDVWVAPKGRGLLDALDTPETLPHWVTEKDFQYYAREYERTGWTGPLNIYRGVNKTWELVSAWTGKNTDVPALYITGDRDMVFTSTKGYIEKRFKQDVPNLERVVVLPAGHFMHQEKSEEVNKAILAFLFRQEILKSKL